MTRRRCRLVALGCLSLTTLGLTPARASTVCVTARVDFPIALPDGTDEPAGSLTLCDVGSFSPVTRVQRLLMNGRSVGLFLAQSRTAEASAEDPPVMLFASDGRGRMTLVGYTAPSGTRSLTHVFSARPRASDQSAPRSEVGVAGGGQRVAVSATMR